MGPQTHADPTYDFVYRAPVKPQEKNLQTASDKQQTTSQSKGANGMGEEEIWNRHRKQKRNKIRKVHFGILQLKQRNPCPRHEPLSML